MSAVITVTVIACYWTMARNVFAYKAFPIRCCAGCFPATLTLPFPEVVNGFMVQYQLAKMVKLAAPPVIIRGNFHLLTPFPWGVSRMILSVVRGLCWPWSADRLLFHLIFCRK